MNSSKVTVAVDIYRPSHTNDQTKSLFQCPISPERIHKNDTILLRNDYGARRNEVAFNAPSDFIKLNSPPKSAYAHGIITIEAQPNSENRVGDHVWLAESASRELNWQCHDQTDIVVVNLRTWEHITVALSDVCWIPKYHLRIGDEGAEASEELLTIAGVPVMKPDKRMYVMALVQRLHPGDDVLQAEPVEVKEIVEHKLWYYQNLTSLQDAEREIGKLVHRVRGAVPCPALLKYTGEEHVGFAQASSPPSSATSDISEGASLRIRIDLSHLDRETESSITQGTMVLNHTVLTKHACGKEPLFQPVPPQGICNLYDRCPTPPNIFFGANMPTLENLYPKHYHTDAHRCVDGTAHDLHCVYKYCKYEDGTEGIDWRGCILPPTIHHTCCTQIPGPWNRALAAPPNTAKVGPGDQIIRGPKGEISVVKKREEGCSDLPVRVKEAQLIPGWDLDGAGLRGFRYYETVRHLESMGIPSGEAWINGQDPASGHVIELLPGRGLPVPGPSSAAAAAAAAAAAPPGPGVPGPSFSLPLRGPRNAPVGHGLLGSASRPIVLDDDDDDDDEPIESDVFADRH